MESNSKNGPEKPIFQIGSARFDAPVLAAGLYLVATPIGHLKDISLRALEVLAAADLVLCEDTRHSARLFEHYGIRSRRSALHDHNERSRIGGLIKRLKEGAAIALISDAGTPLLSDPGFSLVRAVREAELGVFAIPGASALLTALTSAGLAADQFSFFGFPPVKAGQLRQLAESLRTRKETLVFYESPRRLGATLGVFAEIFGPEREVAVMLELTKKFERLFRGEMSEMAARFATVPEKGEAVILIAGAQTFDEEDGDWQHSLVVALDKMPLSEAVKQVAGTFGRPRGEVYEHALKIARK